ncbi:MAG: hypothetical protein O2955_00630 [Planctomycetota bacterium]|nr:hypothetical protein [Planctomycetota bacterium]MDA1210986.1 hypothetical protein [Planctomycetota bacterium]
MNRTKTIGLDVRGTLLIVGILVTGGCEMMKHELQPHRLWRMNRTAPMSGDPYFSISDPVTNSFREQKNTPAVSADAANPRIVTHSAAESPTATANEVAPSDDTPIFE